MRIARNNLIISHGGKHGNARTLRKGAAVKRADSEAIPSGLTQQLTGTAPKEHGGDRTDRKGPQVKTAKQEKHPATPADAVKDGKAKAAEEERAAEQARRAAEAKAKAGPSVPDHKVIQNAGGASEAPPSSDDEDDGPASSEVPEDPTKKRDLTVMRKADVEALAAKHGIEVEEDAKGRTELLRELLAAKLGL